MLLEADGVVGDRRFWLRDEVGALFGGKRNGELLRIRPDWDEATRGLALTFPDGPRVEGLVELGEEVEAELYGEPRPAYRVIGPWQDAISRYVGRQLELLWADPDAIDRSTEGGACRSSPADRSSACVRSWAPPARSTAEGSACCSRSTASARTRRTVARRGGADRRGARRLQRRRRPLRRHVARSRHGRCRPADARDARRLPARRAVRLPFGIYGAVAASGVTWPTRWFPSVRAIGGDRRAARVAGVPVDRLLVAVFVLSALGAALPGALLSYSLATASPTNIGFDVLTFSATAALIGGVSLSGGKGSPVGIAAGVLSLSVLQEILAILGSPDYVSSLITGGLLVIVTFVWAPDLSRWLIRYASPPRSKRARTALDGFTRGGEASADRRKLATGNEVLLLEPERRVETPAIEVGHSDGLPIANCSSSASGSGEWVEVLAVLVHELVGRVPVLCPRSRRRSSHHSAARWSNAATSNSSTRKVAPGFRTRRACVTTRQADRRDGGRGRRPRLEARRWFVELESATPRTLAPLDSGSIASTS